MDPRILLIVSTLTASLMTGAVRAQAPWPVRYSGSQSLNGVAFGDHRFVAVGDGGTLLTSPDGRNWSQETVPKPNVSLYSVGYGDGVWVVGGLDGSILRSTNGTHWTLNAQVLPKRAGAFAHQGGRFVATAAGSIWHSVDGMVWDSVPAVGLVSDGVLAAGGGRFVATQLNGPNRALLVSTNGVEWAAYPRPSEIVYSIGYGGGDQFMVIATDPLDGGRSRAFLSDDFVTWKPGGLLQGRRPEAQSLSPGVFVAAGGGSPEMSYDGSAWSPGGLTGNGVIREIAHGAGRFIAVSSDRSIYQSPDLLTVTTTRPGRLRISGPGGGRYEVRAQDSLDEAPPWPALGEVTIGSSPVEWNDLDAAPPATRLYRVLGP